MKKVYDKKSNQHNTRSNLSRTINENRSDRKHQPISIFDNDTLGNTSNEKFDKIAMKLDQRQQDMKKSLDSLNPIEIKANLLNSYAANQAYYSKF